MDNILMMIDQLENEIMTSKRGVLSSNIRMVDEARVMELLQAVRENLPSSINEAKAILREKDYIIDGARRQAQSIVEEANEQAKRLVMESEIVRRASIDADNIERDSRDYCDYIEDKTVTELDKLYDEAEVSLMNILNDIRSKRDELANAFSAEQPQGNEYDGYDASYDYENDYNNQYRS